MAVIAAAKLPAVQLSAVAKVIPSFHISSLISLLINLVSNNIKSYIKVKKQHVNRLAYLSSKTLYPDI